MNSDDHSTIVFPNSQHLTEKTVDYYMLNKEDVDPIRIKKEREKARKLKKTHWWQKQLSRNTCEYCQKYFLPSQLTMDHRVPLARGGKSTPSNVVPSCQSCNTHKKLHTPADAILEAMKLSAQE